MRAHTTLVMDTLRTEFPEFEMCMNFVALDLAAPTDSFESLTVMASLSRLAIFIGVDEAELQEQVRLFRPYAHELQKSAGYDSVQAWRKSMMMRIAKQKSHSRFTDAMLTALMHYLACCVSTSQIESFFSMLLRCIETQSNASAQFELDLVQIILDRKDSPSAQFEQDVIKRAQETWRQNWGAPRTMSGIPRTDKGHKRHKRLSVKGSWLASRTASIASGASDVLDSAPRPLLEGTMLVESNLQKERLKKRRLEAAPHEATEQEIEAQRKEHKRSCAEGKRRYEQRLQVKASLSNTMNAAALQGWSVYMEETARDAHAVAVANHMVIVHERVLADAIVVSDMSVLQYRTHIAVILGGFYVVNSAFTQMMRYKANETKQSIN